ncbi:MAG: glycoside hydrolase family 65 [Acidobacteriia bacterium]|nr:glycoside hydrolase family 65 [Terriglobia bacterium]
MRFSRRVFFGLLPAGYRAAAEGPIDRQARVRRHNPVLRAIDARSPLSVGNGEFAFTADPTGLQTFPQLYENAMPLCTQSQWGWHTVPEPSGKGPADLRLTPFETHGRKVGYPTSSNGQKDLFDWLRENPHRLHLGRIGFAIGGPQEIARTEQTLDLWSGVLRSRFQYGGREVTVETCCHPTLDLLAVTVSAPPPVVFEFPYGSGGMSAADWNHPERHLTRKSAAGANRLDLARELDRDAYQVSLAWQTPAAIEREGPHRWVLTASADGRSQTADRLALVCWFGRSGEKRATLPSAAETRAAAREHWGRFWSSGGVVDFAAVKDPRARELERRIVLSEYQTAIQCAGSLPPQETGLTCNSWFGKYHLEMHYWHAAHFAVWGRAPLLERSLGWYRGILPSAREKARSQGYTGARWPKMTAPDGRDSPSPIGPLLIWQQPHPISLAELCYRAYPNRGTLERYRNVVFESAEFMASYAWWDARGGRYVLGPPVIPAQENHPAIETWNPTFELEYWADGLETAQLWRERLGMARHAKWDDVRRRLSALPVRDGVYLAHENCPQTFTERNRDHPSMLGALGVLPGAKVDRETMRRTLKKVLAEWKWADTWGWDFPMVAMTAASLGERALAVDALLMETPKNTWLPNGHNWQRANLPLYLPGNGGLLLAIAHMARHKAFPDAWDVRWDGLA